MGGALGRSERELDANMPSRDAARSVIVACDLFWIVTRTSELLGGAALEVSAAVRVHCVVQRSPQQRVGEGITGLARSDHPDAESLVEMIEEAIVGLVGQATRSASPPSAAKPGPLTGILARLEAVLDRKGQV